MILTLTLNPAADKTIFVPHLAVGQLQRVRESHLDPAGKGINVARIADRLGWPVIAFGFLAGEIGALVDKALEEEGVQRHFLRVPGQTRMNITIVDQSTGRATSLYDQGPVVDAERLTAMEAQLEPWLNVCRVLVLAGSLPPGVPADIYCRYIELARARQVRTILDSDGEPLRLGVKARPFLIKPNLREAERLVGRPLPDRRAVIEAAQEIRAQGVDVVIISLGARGAICVDDQHLWLATPPRVKRRSTVGSGDSMVAGLAVSLAKGQSIAEGLRLGTAAGAATAMTAGTSLGSAETINQLLPSVKLRELPFPETGAARQAPAERAAQR